jgi:hypothetical protein
MDMEVARMIDDTDVYEVSRDSGMYLMTFPPLIRKKDKSTIRETTSLSEVLVTLQSLQTMCTMPASNWKPKG